LSTEVSHEIVITLLAGREEEGEEEEEEEAEAEGGGGTVHSKQTGLA